MRYLSAAFLVVALATGGVIPPSPADAAADSAKAGKASKSGKAKAGKPTAGKGAKAQAAAANCGTFMYHDSKSGKCMDARNKK